MNCKVGGAALPEVYRTVALGLGHPLLTGSRGLADVDDHFLLVEESVSKRADALHGFTFQDGAGRY